MTQVMDEQQYLAFLDLVKNEILGAKVRIARSANRDLIQLYWVLGKAICDKQLELGWGKSVVEKLAKDLHKVFPDRKGFSVRNLWSMRQLYLEYGNNELLQQLVAEVPWGQNLAIMSKVKDQEARDYYLRSTVEMGWSRNVLVH